MQSVALTSAFGGSNDQENVFQGQGKRELKNGPSSASKRPALQPVTNIATGLIRNGGDYAKKTTTPNLLSLPTSSMTSTSLSLTTLLTSSTNTSLSNAMHYSFEDSSFSLSTSIMSISSPGNQCSPMLISSPAPGTSGIKCDSECFGEYTQEIFENLKCKEAQLSPPPGFIRCQRDVNTNMRAILVDWLIEVADEFQLHPDTLYLAVSYTDRYLSVVSVPRSKLQLVGTTSLYLAAKLEEIHPPDIGEFAYITDDTYTKKQIVKLEQDMLKVLDFQLVQPTVLTFMARYLEISNLDSSMEQVECMSRYLGELALVDAEPFSKYLPSVIASSALCLSRHALGLNAWPMTLQTHSGYCLSDISQCLQDLHRTHALAHCHPQQAVRQKYLNSKHLQIALMGSPETLPC